MMLINKVDLFQYILVSSMLISFCIVFAKAYTKELDIEEFDKWFKEYLR
jgi:hypothetical protein